MFKRDFIRPYYLINLQFNGTLTVMKITLQCIPLTSYCLLMSSELMVFLIILNWSLMMMYAVVRVRLQQKKSKYGYDLWV